MSTMNHDLLISMREKIIPCLDSMCFSVAVFSKKDIKNMNICFNFHLYSLVYDLTNVSGLQFTPCLPVHFPRDLLVFFCKEEHAAIMVTAKLFVLSLISEKCVGLRMGG